MEWAGAAAQLFLPILTICIIVVTVEASSAKHLINVDCIRSKRKCQSVPAGVFPHTSDICVGQCGIVKLCHVYVLTAGRENVAVTIWSEPSLYRQWSRAHFMSSTFYCAFLNLVFP